MDVTEILSHFKANLSAFDLAGKNLRVAISGGSDSVALLCLLKKALPNTEIKALHIDHGIRPESKKEAEFVKELCARFSIPLDIREVFVEKFTKQSTLGLEEAARNLRYCIFAEYTALSEIVATAHTAGDVIETMLFNLARGSGPRGLSGIPISRDGIIRPLLNFWRRDLQKWLKSESIDWIEDKSNLDLRFSRNRIRWMLIPEMRRVFGESVVYRLRREADIFSSCSKFLDSSALKLFQKARIIAFDQILIIDSKIALETQWGWGEILRLCSIELTNPIPSIDFANVSRLYKTAKASRMGRRYPVSGNLHIEVDGNLIFVFKEIPQIREIEAFIDSRIELQNGMGALNISKNRPGTVVQYDGKPLSIRPAQSGDEINSKRKLRRFLSKKGIPRLLRDTMPIVFSGETPIYAPIIGALKPEPALFSLFIDYEGPLKNIFLNKRSINGKL